MTLDQIKRGDGIITRLSRRGIWYNCSNRNANAPEVLLTPRRALTVERLCLSMATPDSTSNIPYGYCHCGCGQKTTISTSDKTLAKKGTPNQFCQGHRIRAITPLEERFWSKVAITADDDQCWIWLAHTDKDGYGRIRVGSSQVPASRVAYELVNGKLPSNVFACHTCDNPSCVNPKHLFAGTSQDNTNDMIKKGRGAKQSGERNAASKVTESQVLEIRRRYAQGGTSCYKLGREFGLTGGAIWLIVTNKNWSTVQDDNQEGFEQLSLFSVEEST